MRFIFATLTLKSRPLLFVKDRQVRKALNIIWIVLEHHTTGILLLYLLYKLSLELVLFLAHSELPPPIGLPQPNLTKRAIAP